MKASEIRQLTAEELNTKLNDLKAELFNLRFQLAINQLENPMRISAIDVGETKLTLRKAANRNTVKAYAELQNDVFALKYGKIMEGKRGYFYSPPSMGTYTDQDGNKQYQYAYGFASAPERTRISGEIKKQYELMCKKNKRVYEAKIK